MEIYVPDCYQESIFTVNYELLKNRGIRCLLFDLDNTIVPENIKVCSDKTKELFNKLKEDFQVIIFSNSPKRRVSMIANSLGVAYVCWAFKPSPKKFLEVMNNYKYGENEIAIIGDQLLTDVKGGNRVGVLSILVNPVSKYDPLWTKIGRKRERRIMKKLRQRNLFLGRFYDEKV